MADRGIPSWPKVTIRLYDDHNAEVKIAGRSHPVNHHDPRQAAIALVAERAGQLGRAVKATAVESDGSSWPLVIHPDGQVDAVETAPSTRKPIWPILVAAGLALVLIAGTAVYFFLSSRTPAAPAPVAENKLPALSAPEVVPDQFSARPVPPGWSATAAWTVDLAPDSRPAVSPDGREVAVITPDQKLAVFDSAGKVLWQDEVPRDATTPVYTTVDAAPVLAVATPKTLLLWPGDAREPTEIELPDSAQVQFFGTSPLVMLGSDAGASVVRGTELATVPNQPRLATILLAEGDRALMARYQGPLYWSRPDQKLVTLQLKGPKGARSLDHVVAASAGRAIVHWRTGRGTELLVTVNSTADGRVLATCPTTTSDRAGSWKWVPDQAGRVAALGECLIDFAKGRTSLVSGFQPMSVTRTTVYGQVAGNLLAVVPGGKPTQLPVDTARPWGVAGERAIVVHDSVLYALDKK